MSKAHLIARIRVHEKEGLTLSSKCQRRLFLNMVGVCSLVILKWKRSKAIKGPGCLAWIRQYGRRAAILFFRWLYSCQTRPWKSLWSWSHSCGRGLAADVNGWQTSPEQHSIILDLHTKHCSRPWTTTVVNGLWQQGQAVCLSAAGLRSICT